MPSKKTTDDDRTALHQRLDVIIQLLLEMSPEPAKTTTDKILRLQGFGLRDSEVAAIIGKKVNYVTAVNAQKKGRARQR